MASEGLSISLEYVKCDLCGEDNSQVLCHKKSTRIGEWFNIVKCKNCGLIYVNPRLSKEEAISLLYDERYFSLPQYNTGAKSERYRAYHELVKRFAQLQRSSHGDRLLDLGCGAGHLLMAAKEWGYDVFGLDISPTACGACRSQRLSVYCGEITDQPALSELEGSFDVITAMGTLDQLHKPKLCLKRVYEFLRPGGILIHNVINHEGIEIQGANWGSLLPDQRIYYFTPSVIQAYFNEIGF